MLKFITILYLVLHCWLLVSVAGDQCPFQECDCVKKVISCEKRGFTEIPLMIGGPYFGQTILRLDSNNITDIDDESFPPILQQIDFSQNPISTIDIAAFDDSHDTLETLSFSAARFTRIPNALLHLYALKSFSVSDTKIVDWNVKAMNHIALTLEHLYLVNVTVYTWPTWLQNFDHLVELSLDSNSLSSIPNDGLDVMASTLKTLILSNNKFTTIPRAVSKLTAIQSLDLSRNRISNPDAGSLPPSLLDLFLDNNHLSSIPRNLFNLTSLQTIYMTFNDVREINGTDIPAWIANIDLSYNLIEELTDTSFPPNSNITSLTLTSNPIVTVSQNAFKNLQQLQTLSWKNSTLTRLPLALASLTKVTFFDISGSPNLVCTCQEKSLGPWFLSLEPNTDSVCGSVSIHFFFQNLSQMCP